MSPTLLSARQVAHTSEMSREEWLSARRSGIGGSDVAAICGLSRYRSPFEVWLDKSGAPTLDDGEQSEAALWGTRLEPLVRSEVAAREGLTIHELPVLLAHLEHDWMLANVDGLAWSPEGAAPAIYEGKTTGHWGGGLWGTDEEPLVPDAALLQGLHYLAVTGRERVIYGVLIAGQRLVIRHVQRDDELITHLIDIESTFWQQVQDGTPPDPDGSEATTDLLAHLWDAHPGSVLTVSDPDPVRTLLLERSHAKAAVKAAEERAHQAENKLKTLAGEHEVIRDTDGQDLFTWKAVEQTRLDAKSLTAAHPEIAAQHMHTTTHRRFHVPKGAI